ncbi:MAG: hypothetical protein ACREBR_04220, partial [bacterium]
MRYVREICRKKLKWNGTINNGIKREVEEFHVLLRNFRLMLRRKLTKEFFYLMQVWLKLFNRLKIYFQTQKRK